MRYVILGAPAQATAVAPAAATSQAPGAATQAASGKNGARSLEGPVSGKLSADEYKKILAGEIILRSAVDEKTESGSGYAIGLIKATPKQIFDTIIDFDKYVEFMPRMLECKRTRLEGNLVDADFRLDMDITSIVYSINHTIYPAENKLTWVLDKTKKADYITATTGYWLAEEIPEGSLVEYSVAVDLEVKVPGMGWFVKKISKYLTHKDLPSVIDTLKKRVESGNTLILNKIKDKK
jgi:ribosome-associated toxin RatA of RatAB toxin-antitoxin module